MSGEGEGEIDGGMGWKEEDRDIPNYRGNYLLMIFIILWHANPLEKCSAPNV